LEARAPSEADAEPELAAAASMSAAGGEGDDDGSRGADPATIDLFPKVTLQEIAGDGKPVATPAPPPKPPDVVTVPGWLHSHDLRLPGPVEFPRPSPFIAADNRKKYFGPLYAAITTPPDQWDTSLREQISAEAALTLLPAALIGPACKPAVDFIYGLIDRVPTFVRRPLERDFGLLIDNAMSVTDALVTPLVDQTMQKFFPDGRGLPAQFELKIQGFSQFKFACGETAAATILKASGEPVALADVDTQISGFDGTSGLMDAEFKRRGLTLVTGPGDLNKLKTFLASGYPVLVGVGWNRGGGHAVVVSGYDDVNKTLTIKNWDDAGGTNTVSYDDFLPNWKRRFNGMTAVVPIRDHRLDALVRAGDPRRRDEIQPGLSLSDFWVTEKGAVFVEAAYRYVTEKTDLTVRMSFGSDEQALGRQLNGSIALRQRLAAKWLLGISVVKMTLKHQDDQWRSFTGAPLAVLISLDGPGFSIRMGEEHGAFDGAVAIDLGQFMAGLGLQVNASIDASGVYRLFGSISGTI
jgi:hypothetical protein